jgi:hypothetical protein
MTVRGKGKCKGPEAGASGNRRDVEKLTRFIFQQN